MYRTLVIASFLVLLPVGELLASSYDSLVYETTNLKILSSKIEKDYCWLNKNTGETVKHLKFVQELGNEFQILDSENQVFYIDASGNRSDTTTYRRWVCGTVPHYTVSVVETDSTFEVYEDETFYDHKNQTPAALQTTISKKDADSVLLINGRREFNFDSNFDYVRFVNSDPRTVILVKDRQFFTSTDREKKYDTFIYWRSGGLLLTRRGALYGILDVVSPKYAEISPFEYYLAQVKLPNGEVRYIDTEGNEY